MDNKKRRKTKKRCPIGTKIDEKLDKCVPIDENPGFLSNILPANILPANILPANILPANIFGNLLDIQRPGSAPEQVAPVVAPEQVLAPVEAAKKKRCPKGKHINRITNECDTVVKKTRCLKGTQRNTSGICEPKNITRKISLEPKEQ